MVYRSQNWWAVRSKCRWSGDLMTVALILLLLKENPTLGTECAYKFYILYHYRVWAIFDYQIKIRRDVLHKLLLLSASFFNTCHASRTRLSLVMLWKPTCLGGAGRTREPRGCVDSSPSSSPSPPRHLTARPVACPRDQIVNKTNALWHAPYDENNIIRCV